MADNVAFGGQNWWGELLQGLTQAMQGQRQQEQVSGYYYPSMYEPQPLNEEQAAQAIWSNRPDIQDFYLAEWGLPEEAEGERKNWRPVDAIRDWVGMTGELSPEQKEMGIEDLAVQMGYATDYADAERQPTLQRYIAENRVRLEEMSHEQRADEFEQRLDFDREQAEQAAYEFEQTHGLREELGRGELALGYMQQMANVQGPRDWMRYNALQRAGQQTDLPEWQRRLAEGLGFPSFQAGAPMGREVPVSIPPNEQMRPYDPEMSIPPNEQVREMTGAEAMGLDFEQRVNQAQATGQPQATGQAPLPAGIPQPQQQMAPWQQDMAQYIQPHQISSQQWQNMDPSEREMLAGVVQTPQELGGYGGYWPDYQKRMQAAFPQGSATGISYWR